MASLRLPPDLLNVVHQYDREHVQAELQRQFVKLRGITECRDPAHRQALLETALTTYRQWFPQLAPFSPSAGAPVSPAQPASAPPSTMSGRGSDAPAPAFVAPTAPGAPASVAAALRTAPTAVRSCPAAPRVAKGKVELGTTPVAIAAGFEVPPAPVFTARTTPGAGAYRVARASATPVSTSPAGSGAARSIPDWRTKASRLAQHHSSALAQAFGRALN